MACIARGQAESESYRRQVDERARAMRERVEDDVRQDALFFASRAVKALESIAAALEERLPPIEDASMIEKLKARILQLAGEKVGLQHELDRLRLQQPDLGIRCRECGKPITGIGAVARSMKCLECYKKPTL